jgi:hypothetical protein
LEIHSLIEDAVTIDAKPMSWVILRTAVSKDEAGLKAERRMNVALNAQKSAIGQAYVAQKKHPQNKGKFAINFQHITEILMSFSVTPNRQL